MIIDLKAFPICVAAAALLCANLSAFSFPWVDVNVNISDGDFVYQSDASIGLLQCTSDPCVSDYCCHSYNNGNLFDFPPWGFYVIPVFPGISDDSVQTGIGNILLIFQYATYPVLFLIVISSILCVISLLMALYSFVYTSSFSFKQQRFPLWLAILCNSIVIFEYFLLSVFVLNGGVYSFGFCIISYVTIIAIIGYVTSFNISAGPFEYEGGELTPLAPQLVRPINSITSSSVGEV